MPKLDRGDRAGTLPVVDGDISTNIATFGESTAARAVGTLFYERQLLLV